jgi:hypothetical protein
MRHYNTTTMTITPGYQPHTAPCGTASAGRQEGRYKLKAICPQRRNDSQTPPVRASHSHPLHAAPDCCCAGCVTAPPDSELRRCCPCPTPNPAHLAGPRQTTGAAVQPAAELFSTQDGLWRLKRRLWPPSLHAAKCPLNQTTGTRPQLYVDQHTRSGLDRA